MRINYTKFIEENFAILDKESQRPVPFVLNPIQRKYAEMLSEEYPDLEGIREIVLKARQEGMSSFILALFTVDFICIPHSISICISHRKDATELLFKKVKFYIESYCNKNGFDVKQYLGTETKGLITSQVKNSMFYIGTAGAKVGGRGGSARNILFSECAFYQDTELITAREIVVGTAQQVPQGRGMIFIESTANGMDNYYQQEWERANLPPDKDGRPASIYRPRFFAAKGFYSEEWLAEKASEFPTERLYKQEYPDDPDEAFISSGEPFFDNQLLKAMMDTRPEPVIAGRIAPDGQFA
jgi:hypothetical protein